MEDDHPSKQLSDEEVVHRLTVLRHNIQELRVAARTCAQTHPDFAEEFEEMAHTIEDAEATLTDSVQSEESPHRVYRETLHRLQNIRSVFDDELLTVLDETVAPRLQSWD